MGKEEPLFCSWLAAARERSSGEEESRAKNPAAACVRETHKVTKKCQRVAQKEVSVVFA